ncbi:MAG: MarR family transcriptional regulator [Oscillospiraceae bacterium]|jgi:DNA-binding MarR family transcriptional regulator|nr:MarR family transcriptional regulator [Oscillospiraceae bacterium]
MNYDMLKLENQLCFPLYAAANKIVNRYKPLLDEVGLTYTQYIVMMVLWERKSVSVSELGKRLYLDSGTLTPLLKRLERKGLVRRARSSADERVVNVSVTEAGDLLKETAKNVPLRMGRCLPFVPEETQSLYALLYKLLAGLEGE